METAMLEIRKIVTLTEETHIEGNRCSDMDAMGITREEQEGTK